MTRSTLPRSPRSVAGMWWYAYVLLAGTLAFGAGWAVARSAGAVAGTAAAVAFTAAAGWWAPPPLPARRRTLPPRRDRTPRSPR